MLIYSSNSAYFRFRLYMKQCIMVAKRADTGAGDVAQE
jgi:hypothetical protein